jgi:hypothetical protein
MSLRPIEMQIAIPRTNEATSTQNQLLHKPAHDQSVLADHAMKRTEDNRQRSAEVEESTNSKIRDGEGNSGGGNGTQSGSKRQAKKHQAPAKHPYKGKHIDISL